MQAVQAAVARALLVQMQAVRRAQQTLAAVAAALQKHQAQVALAAQASSSSLTPALPSKWLAAR